MRRGLFWACCTFMLAFSSLRVITGWLGGDAADFLLRGAFHPWGG
ncbi:MULTISPECIES: hypothetical protein [unclassified Meiothermus]|nr:MULTISPECIES: hypothetical protein [unclassified Meiothermus]